MAEPEESAPPPIGETAPETETGTEEWSKRLEAKQKEHDALYDRYLRLAADFDNYKKRVIKERSELLRYGSEPLLREILEVSDNLDRAVRHAASESTEGSEPGLREGLDLISKQLHEVLARFQVVPIESLGRPFDPEVHQALAEVETEAQPPGTVMEEVQRGYRLHDRVLRPAVVTVAKKKEPLSSPAIGEQTEAQG
jgi:molecular chaperone GrpE